MALLISLKWERMQFVTLTFVSVGVRGWTMSAFMSKIAEEVPGVAGVAEAIVVLARIHCRCKLWKINVQEVHKSEEQSAVEMSANEMPGWVTMLELR